MIFSTILLGITGVFGGMAGGFTSPPNDKGVFKKWLDRLANAIKRFAGKAVKASESIFGAILSFLGKAVGFVAEHTWALIVFAAGLIGVWLMQRVKKD